MKALVTGADGFIGRNLSVRLQELKDIEVLPFTRQCGADELAKRVAEADVIVHLAGANRPQNPAGFIEDNADLTARLSDAVRSCGRPVPILFASSIQAENDTPYGRSKQAAEHALLSLHAATGNPLRIFRLPNVFGKWCRPNYNSVVATFCHNVCHGLPLRVDDPGAQLRLVYIDDVISAFIDQMRATAPRPDIFVEVAPVYSIAVGGLAEQIASFMRMRPTLHVGRVGTGLTRALYATFVSYLPAQDFSYGVEKHEDPRGVFVEMLKTADSGQFSYFTAHPGVTRGGHYHHSKTEKFLVLKGTARFRFRHLISNEIHEVVTTGDRPTIVDTIPGWSHDITNIGSDEMIVMLWANEVFDRIRPDTVARAV